ncbi:RHS repeat-associated protein [Kitasatospora herbaricolor]|uniref:RHS repeat-associated core domain-containing protein n=1 Tax=Kitasatospora herbaricolor TaxID=68217 RepID=UPI002791CF4D|nr:RHS repeat-associated core domain-containing protein [Kitasatospora herbaricolor]MDQ0305496.1 RHS repeat-associated protein [Kitasatospora herbaricolor]
MPAKAAAKPAEIAPHYPVPARAVATPPKASVKQERATADLGTVDAVNGARAGGLPVWASSPPKSPSDTAKTPRSVTVEQADGAKAGAAGVSGLLFSLTATGTTLDNSPANSAAPTGAATAPVKIAVDVAALNAQSDGGFASRGRLVTLPACALTTPQVPSCLVRTPVATTYDAPTNRLVADIDLSIAPEDAVVPSVGAAKSSFTADAPIAPAVAPGFAPVLLAAENDGSGPGGAYTATALSSSSNWAAGNSSGAMTYSYSVETPPALAGPEPDLTLGYNSSSVDGKTSATNSQASWVGDGWDFNPGFIERTFKPCSKDGITKSGDLCWGGYNATLSLGSHSGELVRESSTAAASDKDTGVWHLQGDDGTKVEFGGDAANGSYNGAYAKVTDTSGTVYYFGLNHLPGGDKTDPETKSASYVPVYSPQAADPCYSSATGLASTCPLPMWQRLSLDYVVDTHGNLTTYTWAPEENWYARGGGQNNGNGIRDRYIRATTVARIDYGQRLSDQVAAKGTLQPAAHITFGTEERCLGTGTTCDVNNRTVANQNNWPDVPVDQECKQTGTCTNYSPTYFTTKRLTKIATQVRVNNTWQDVDSYELKHSFPDPSNTPKDYPKDTISQKALWLDSIQRTGKTATDALNTPPVTFTPVMLPNRVDGSDLVPAPPLMNRPRIQQIHNETGGVLNVNYQLPSCSRVNHVMPAAEDDNTLACYPVRWSPPGSGAAADPILDWFSHYVVASLTETDSTTNAEQKITAYQYGKAGWHRDDNEFTDPKARTWGEFRGFSNVTTTIGSGNDGPKGQSRTTYRQGMDGDARKAGGTRSIPLTALLENTTDPWLISKLGQATDVDWLAGQALLTETLDQAGGAVVAQSVSSSSGMVETATHERGNELPKLIARIAPTTTTTTTRSRLSDSSWRTNTAVSTTDPDHGNRPHTLLDQADGLPDLCLITSYATAPQRSDLVAESLTITGTTACTDAAVDTAGAGNTVARDRVLYDGLSYGQATATGDPTEKQALDHYDSTGTAKFVPVSSNTFDVYGRAITATDPNSTDSKHPNGATTRFNFSSAAAGELPTTVTVSVPVPGADANTTWDGVTTYDARRSLPLTVRDLNSKTVTSTYDALGRLTGVWAPGRTPATDTNANKKFEYNVSDKTGVPSTVTMSTLTSDGQSSVYMRQISLLDGFGRTRQTQASPATPGLPGRMISDTFYDSQGRAWKSNAAWYNDADTPSTTLLNAVDDSVPAQSRTSFDGQGRPVISTLLSYNVQQSQTITAYPGADRTDVIPPPGTWPTSTLVDARGRTSELWQYNTPTATGQTADAAVSRFSYTADGELATRVDSVGNTWSYGYDLRGRQTSASDPDTGTTTTTFDPASRITFSTNANGQVLSYTYDLDGRKTGLYEGPVSDSNRLAAWTFDTVVKGLPASSTRYVGGSSGLAYTTAVTGYDEAYRPTGSTITIPGTEVGQSAGTTYTYSVGAEYNPITGNLDTTMLPTLGGLPRENLNYSYNRYGQMVNYGGATRYDVESEYDAFGRPIRSTVNPWGTQVVSTTDYDQATSRVLGQYLDYQPATKGAVNQTNYTYNPAGAITSITDIPDNTPTATDRQCFTYDVLGRLTTAWTDTGSITKPDVLQHKTQDQGACTNTTPTSGAVAPATNTVGGANPYWQDYTYDPTGNRTSLTSHGSAGAAAVLDPSQVTQISAAADASQTWGVGLAGGKVWTSAQNADGTWAPFSDLMVRAGALANVESVSAAVSDGKLQVMAVAGGKIWHTLRGVDGKWQPWGDVFSVVGALAQPSQLALTATTSGLEVLTFSGGKLWHTVRLASGSWQTQGWGDVYSVVGPLTSPSQMAAAATASGLEIMASASGKLWHTVRMPNGQWQVQGWGDVYSVTGTLSGALTGSGQLALASTTGGLQTIALAGGKPWRAVRDSAGQWAPWADLTAAAGTVAAPTTVGAVGSGADLKLLVAGSGQLNYTKRDGTNNVWSPWSLLKQPPTTDTTTTSGYPAAGTRNTPTTAANTGGGTGGAHALLNSTVTSPGGSETTAYQYDAAGNTTRTGKNSTGAAALTWNSEGKLASYTAPGQITGIAGKCIATAGGSSASGTNLQINSCSSGGSQLYTTADNTLSTLGKCAQAMGTTTGAAVQLQNCDKSAAQTWTPRADKTLYNPASGRCLAVPGDVTTSSTALALGDCATTVPAGQKWTLPNTTTTYLYDADGNQLIRRNPDKTTINLGTDELTLDTATKTNQTGTRYYPIPGGMTIVRTGVGTAPGTFVVQNADHHGTNTTSVDLNTGAINRRPTDPFGNPRGTQPAPGAWASDKGYVGGTKDDTTKLTNLGARQYDPTTGRFISPDPILDAGDPQQWNGYAYSSNNPVNLSDPSGLSPNSGCTRHWYGLKCTYGKDHPSGNGIDLLAGIFRGIINQPTACFRTTGPCDHDALGHKIDKFASGFGIDTESDTYWGGSSAGNFAFIAGGLTKLATAGYKAIKSVTHAARQAGGIKNLIKKFTTTRLRPPVPIKPKPSESGASREAEATYWGGNGGGSTNFHGPYLTPLTPGIKATINPTGGRRNCGLVACATDYLLGGKGVNPVTIPVKPLQPEAIAAIIGSGSFRDKQGLTNVVGDMVRWGNGARAIVIGTPKDPTEPMHAFNVINDNGNIVFIDGQLGEAWHVANWFKYQILRTN